MLTFPVANSNWNSTGGYNMYKIFPIVINWFFFQTEDQEDSPSWYKHSLKVETLKDEISVWSNPFPTPTVNCCNNEPVWEIMSMRQLGPVYTKRQG